MSPLSHNSLKSSCSSKTEDKEGDVFHDHYRIYDTNIDDDAPPIEANMDSGIDFDINIFNNSNAIRSDVYVCYLEDANDVDWEVLYGAACVPGDDDNYLCTLEISSFGIYAPCVLFDDCNGVILYQ